MKTFRKLGINEENECVVSNSSEENVVQGSVLADAIAYANQINARITLQMAGKEICIAPNADWHEVCDEFFD